jgi:hypothetical protein
MVDGRIIFPVSTDHVLNASTHTLVMSLCKLPLLTEGQSLIK